MKFVAIALLFFVGRLASASPAVCFYENINYQGASFCQNLNMQDSNLSSTGWNRRISSVSIIGSATVTLFSEFNFGGSSIVLNGSQPDLRISHWNDVASSYRVVAPPAQVCFFQDVNWNGHSFCLPAGRQIADLRTNGWNDAISSIRVDGNAKAQIFEDIQFGGKMEMVMRSIPSMNIFGSIWNDHVSSVIVTPAQ